ncbi:MAG TPA: hypothetical protein VI122_12665 [Thermoleophilaceae bacterium]
MAAWTAYFQEHGDDALAFRDELKSLGMRPPEGLQAKQLGLSVALTPPAFRCGHYGDTRFCQQCGVEPAQNVKGPEDELEEKTEAAKRQSEVIRNQSDAIDRQSAEIRRLQSGSSSCWRVWRHGNHASGSSEVTMEKSEMVAILEEIASDRRNASAQVSAIRLLRRFMDEEEESPENAPENEFAFLDEVPERRRTKGVPGQSA